MKSQKGRGITPSVCLPCRLLQQPSENPDIHSPLPSLPSLCVCVCGCGFPLWTHRQSSKILSGCYHYNSVMYFLINWTVVKTSGQSYANHNIYKYLFRLLFLLLFVFPSQRVSFRPFFLETKEDSLQPRESKTVGFSNLVWDRRKKRRFFTLMRGITNG